jgi:hypothetical protein
MANEFMYIWIELGPFTTEQMTDWYKKNFFTEDLPIRRGKDIMFDPLNRYLMRFGRESPFMAADEAEILSAKQLILEQQQQQHHQLDLHQQQQRLRFGGFDGSPQQQQQLPQSQLSGFGGGFGGQQQQQPQQPPQPRFVGGPDILGSGSIVGGREGPGFGVMGGMDPMMVGGFGGPMGYMRPGWAGGLTGIENDLMGRGGPGGPNAGFFGLQRGAVGIMPFMQPPQQQQVNPLLQQQLQQQQQQQHQQPQTGGFSNFGGPSELTFGTQQPISSLIGGGGQNNWGGLSGSNNNEELRPVGSPAPGPAILDSVTDMTSKLSLSRNASSSPSKSYQQPNDLESSLASPKPVSGVPSPVKAVSAPSPRQDSKSPMTSPVSSSTVQVASSVVANDTESGGVVSPVEGISAEKASATAVKKPKSVKKSVPAPMMESEPLPPPPTVATVHASEDETALRAKKAAKTEYEKSQKETPAATTTAPSPATEKSRKDVPVSAPVQPAWNKDSKGPKLSLKEIQEAEEKVRVEKEKEKAKRAHQLLMAQAQALSEAESRGSCKLTFFLRL